MTDRQSLSCQNLSLGHGKDAPLIENLSVTVEGGSFVVLVGPNGSGKSTLLRGLVGDLQPRSGQVSWNAKPLKSLSLKDRGQTLAYLPQARNAAYAMRVYDVVALGLYAFGGNVFGRLGTLEQARIDAALDQFELKALQERPLNHLSGGEQGRVHLARAMVSGAKMLVVDEPITALDMRHQIEVLDHLKALSQQGHLVLAVLHDLSLAAQVADRVLVLSEGRLVADGVPSKVFTSQLGREVFGIDLRPQRDEDGQFGVVTRRL